MNKRLIVLSIDSLQSNDLDFLFSLPNFSKIKNKMSVVKNLEEIYPTLTYPIHTTILTGVTPDKHGIYHNQKFLIKNNDKDWNNIGSEWYWYKENIKVPTIIDYIAEANKTFATICWPVTAGDKRGINVPEIWPEDKLNTSSKELFEKASSDNVFKKYFDSYISKFKWNNNDDLVRFTPEIALDILKNDKPEILFCHIIWLDSIRHLYGTKGIEVTDCLRQLDCLFGRFIEITKDNSLYEDTNFVILGDHGQIDIKHIFNLNVLFVNNNLIELDENNKPKDYIAYSFSAGFSTQIFLKNPENENDLKKVYEILNKLKNEYPEYIEKIYTKDEAEKLENLSGDFSFIIEGSLGTYFGSKYSGKIIINKGDKEYYIYSATHGHSVSKGPKPPLIAFGPSIKENVVIENAKILDVCPTLANLCNVKMDNLMGKTLDIIKTN